MAGISRIAQRSSQVLRNALRYPSMARLLAVASVLVGMSVSCFAQTWALTTSTHPNNGRQIVFRYMDTFGSGFERSSQPVRIILAWQYLSDNGMPIPSERQRMDEMEDLLGPVVDKEGFATLVLVSTGENLREWTYYVKSEVEFMAKLNKALAGKPAFPIDIHPANDPNWTMYEKFRAWAKK